MSEQRETVVIGTENLQALLEFAYRGDASLGGNCRNHRSPDCGLCPAFDEAESLLQSPADYVSRNWWGNGIYERFRMWIRRHPWR